MLARLCRAHFRPAPRPHASPPTRRRSTTAAAAAAIARISSSVSAPAEPSPPALGTCESALAFAGPSFSTFACSPLFLTVAAVLILALSFVRVCCPPLRPRPLTRPRCASAWFARLSDPLPPPLAPLLRPRRRCSCRQSRPHPQRRPQRPRRLPPRQSPRRRQRAPRKRAAPQSAPPAAAGKRAPRCWVAGGGWGGSGGCGK